MFGFGKKNKNVKENSNKPVEVEQKSLKIKNTEFFKEYYSKKKELLPKGTITREDLLIEIEKQLQTKNIANSNPFKTRDDRYFLFFNSNMRLNREPVPFEEVSVGGKKFYINKEFENGKIRITQLFGSPDLEINLKEEFNKKETTKKQLEKINQYILFIKNKIARGEDKYKLLDIQDLKEEKWRLEKILESIKYGKSAIFDFQDPITRKKSYWLIYSNGEYHYLKVTENGFICEENNIKFIKGYEIQKRLEEIANLRIMKNWKEIIYGIVIFFIIIGTLFSIFKLTTFEEDLFDKRVQTFCGDQAQAYIDQIEYIKNSKCEIVNGKPSFNTKI